MTAAIETYDCEGVLIPGLCLERLMGHSMHPFIASEKCSGLLAGFGGLAPI